MASGNPLFPGYYPGSPYVRPPSEGGGSGPRKFIPKRSIEFYKDKSFFESLAANVPLNFPRWLWQQQVDEYEDAFLHFASAKNPQEIEEGYAQFEGEEGEELPGAAGIMVNLSPVDWVKDPVKQIKKHFESSYKAIADLQDFTTDSKAYMWRTGYFEDERSPFYLKDGGGVYDQVEAMVPHYMTNSASAITRNEAFAKANLSILNALDDEFYAKRVAFNGEQLREIDHFAAKVGIANSMKDLKDAMYGTSRSFSGVFVNRKTHDTDDAVTKLGVEITKAKVAIAELESFSAETPEELKGYKKFIQSLDEEFNKHAKVEGTGLSTRWVLNKGSETGLNKVTDFYQTQLFKRTVNAGIGGTYINNLVNKEIRDPKSSINKFMDTAKRLDGSYVVSEGGRRLWLVSAMMRRDYDWMTATDLASSFESGKLPRQFIWSGIIYPRIKRYTPSYYVDRLKDKLVAYEFFGRKGLSFKNGFKTYAKALEKLQASTLSKAYGFAVRPAEIIGRKLWNWIGMGLETLLGPETGGIGSAIIWVARVVFAYIVNKVSKYVGDAFKALRHLDINLAMDLQNRTFAFLGKAVISIVAIFAGLALIVSTLVGTVLTTLPIFDSTKVGDYTVGQGTLSPQNITTSDEANP